MKKNILFAAVAVLSLLVAVSSCTPKEEPDTKVYEISMSYPKTDVLSGEEVNFIDNSLYVQSRTWTFEGGSPATSTEPAVAVTFDAAGKHKVTLEVTFTNKSVQSKTIEVNVLKEIKGEIKVEGLTPLGCAKFNKEISFSIADLEGDVDTYEWTFEGGTPASSTEAAPKVKFNARDLDCKVSCVISRSSDDAYLELSKSFVVGNYPIYKPSAEFKFDPYSFEMENANCYIIWTENATNRGNVTENGICSIVDGGACNTGHCLKMDFSKLDPNADGSFGDVFPRDNWMTNGYLEPGKKYELKFWVKGDHTSADGVYNIPGFMFRYQLQDWMAVSACMEGLTAGDGYKDVYGIDFPGNADGTMYQSWWEGFGDGADKTWIECKKEFTLADFGITTNVYNPYVYFRVYSGQNNALYFDELELNLIED